MNRKENWDEITKYAFGCDNPLYLSEVWRLSDGIIFTKQTDKPDMSLPIWHDVILMDDITLNVMPLIIIIFIENIIVSIFFFSF